MLCLVRKVDGVYSGTKSVLYNVEVDGLRKGIIIIQLNSSLKRRGRRTKQAVMSAWKF